MLLQIDTENTPASQLLAMADLLAQVATERGAKPAGFSDTPPPPSDPPPAGDAEDDADDNDVPSGERADSIPPPPAAAIPPPPAAAPPPPPPAAVPAAAELDSAGVAWNPAIHSSTKSKMKNTGEWKKKRNRSAETPPATSTAPATTVPPPPPPPTGDVTQTPPVNGAQPAALPPPPPPPPPAAAPAAQPAATGPTFRSLVARIGELQKAQKLPPEVLAAIFVTVGAPDLMSLLSMPHLVPAVDEAITKATA